MILRTVHEFVNFIVSSNVWLNWSIFFRNYSNDLRRLNQLVSWLLLHLITLLATTFFKQSRHFVEWCCWYVSSLLRSLTRSRKYNPRTLSPRFGPISVDFLITFMSLWQCKVIFTSNILTKQYLKTCLQWRL